MINNCSYVSFHPVFFPRIDPMVMNFWVEFQISPLNVILKFLFLKEPKWKISFGLSSMYLSVEITF